MLSIRVFADQKTDVDFCWMDVNGGCVYRQDFATMDLAIAEMAEWTYKWAKELTCWVELKQGDHVYKITKV